MTQKQPEKYFDVRTVDFYLRKNAVTKQDIEKHIKDLPNDENNFEVAMIDTDDDIGLGDKLSEEELKAMPEITEDNIDDFDFLDEEKDS